MDALLADGVPESPTLDFKLLPPEKSDAGRTEFLKDVCALANSAGGDLVFGVGTTEDVVSVIQPITTEAADALKRRLIAYLDGEVQPRIRAELQEVPVSPGYVLVVRVPRSFTGPHRYRAHGSGIPAHHRFVLRSGTATVDMDYAQIRAAFDQGASLVDNARTFRTERLAAVSSGQPRAMKNWPVLVLHAIPLAGMEPRNVVDIAKLYRDGPTFIMPGGSRPQRVTNSDGLLLHSPVLSGNVVEWVVQIFRSGALEFAVSIGRTDPTSPGDRFIPAEFVSERIRLSCEQAIESIRWTGMSGPAIFGLAVRGAGDFKFRIFRNGGPGYGNGVAEKTHFELPEVWVEDIASLEDVHRVVASLLDPLWQSFGEVDCEMYGREWSRPLASS